MLFKGIGRTFSTENDRQYETIGAFWDELAAKHGRMNLQGLGYGWTERSIEYAIGLIDGEIDGANRTVKLPDTGWVTVWGKTADLGKIYEKIYREGRLKFEIERFTDSGDCEIMYCRSTGGNEQGGLEGMFTKDMISPADWTAASASARWPEPIPVPDAAAQTTTSRSFVQKDAASFCAKRENRTGICSAMSARIIPAPTSWKRRPGTDRSTRFANPHWRICGSSGRRGWPLFWTASGSSGPVPHAEASSVSIQVCAAAAAGSTPAQWSSDAKRGIGMQEITFAKGNEQHLKDCRDALCRSTLGERYFSSPGSAENAILEGIRRENLYVALIGEECAGFTYIIPKGAFHGFPYLHIIAVKQEYRNKGIGKALLDYSEKIACAMADKLFLVVADYNSEAKRFYERNGYRQVGEIPNLYRPGVTEYLMVKDLKK